MRLISNVRACAFLLLSLFCATAMAQGELQFRLLPAEPDDLPGAVAGALDVKLGQALTRNGAAAADATCVFAIQPVLQIGDAATTEGLVQNVSAVKAELVLTAINTLDGAKYYSLTIPLNAHATGDRTEALRKAVAAVKYTDPAFTRFIRVARQKIQDYYADNCAVIMQRANALIAAGRQDAARSILEAVAPQLPCYESAVALLAQLAPAAPAPQPEAKPDTVVVERVVEKPVVVQAPEQPEPAPEPESEPAPQPEPEPKSKVRVTYSDGNVRISNLNVYGKQNEHRVYIDMTVTHLNTSNNEEDLYEYKDRSNAITMNGTTFQIESEAYYRFSAPLRVPVRRSFYIENVNDPIPVLAYIELNFSFTKVKIYDVPVVWK